MIIPGSMSVESYRTFAVRQGVDGLDREVPATCADVRCEAFERGWRTVLDLSTDLGQRQWKHIRDHSGRAYTDISARDGVTPPLRVLWFEPGQRCFRQHTMRPQLFVAYRGRPGYTLSGIRRYDRADQWADDFATHQQTLAEQQRRG